MNICPSLFPSSDAALLRWLLPQLPVIAPPSFIHPSSPRPLFFSLLHPTPAPPTHHACSRSFPPFHSISHPPCSTHERHASECDTPCVAAAASLSRSRSLQASKTRLRIQTVCSVDVTNACAHSWDACTR